MANEIQMASQARVQAGEQAADLTEFDFTAPAELFPSRRKKGRCWVTYKRFDTAAEALRFAVEDMPGLALLGACLESEETRFGRQEILRLYESAAYPLIRRATPD